MGKREEVEKEEEPRTDNRINFSRYFDLCSFCHCPRG